MIVLEWFPPIVPTTTYSRYVYLLPLLQKGAGTHAYYNKVLQLGSHSGKPKTI